MSLMAGFDFIAEMSNETIRKLIETNLQIGGITASPPFELTLPLSGSGASGTAHLVVTDLQLDLNADDTISLVLLFNRASLALTAPMAISLCPLDGTLTMTAPVQLVSTGGSNQQVSVNMGAATVNIQWSTAANQTIANRLNGTPVTPALFNVLATQALTSYAHSIGAPTVPIGFRVVPGTNGSLGQNLQFEKLEVHCIPSHNRGSQALGIFGILLAANHANGNHSLKTSTAITAAHDGVCVSIAPGAFHSLVFCPNIASALSTAPGQLPATCGSAGGFDTQGVTLTNLSDSFANGHINLDGAVDKSGFCYDAHGTFHGAITFTVSGTTLIPHVNMDQPNVSVDIPWYCWLVAGVVLGPLGLLLAGIADAVATSIAQSLAGSALNGFLGGGIPGVGVSGLSGASFNSAGITTEGLTLQGTAPIFVPAASGVPSLQLSGSVITVDATVLGAGIFHARVWCLPTAKDYPYTEYAQHQRGVYQFSGTMVTQPLTPQYTISHGGSTVPLVGTNGTVSLPNVDTHYPMPLATGGTSLQQTVHIGYTISGTSIQLTNLPSEGNYSVVLRATATDCSGTPVRDAANQPVQAAIQVSFEGDHVDIGGGYAADVQLCMLQLIARLPREVQPQFPPQVFPPVNFPGPDSMIQYIRDMIAMDTPLGDEMLVASRIAHGFSFYRALFSPAATQPTLMAAKSGIAEQQQLANLAHDLTYFTEKLRSVGSTFETVGAMRKKANTMK